MAATTQQPGSAKGAKTNESGKKQTVAQLKVTLEIGTYGWPELYIYGVHTVFLAWKSPNIRCIYTHIYVSGQP